MAATIDAAGRQCGLLQAAERADCSALGRTMLSVSIQFEGVIPSSRKQRSLTNMLGHECLTLVYHVQP